MEVTSQSRTEKGPGKPRLYTRHFLRVFGAYLHKAAKAPKAESLAALNIQTLKAEVRDDLTEIVEGWSDQTKILSDPESTALIVGRLLKIHRSQSKKRRARIKTLRRLESDFLKVLRKADAKHFAAVTAMRLATNEAVAQIVHATSSFESHEFRPRKFKFGIKQPSKTSNMDTLVFYTGLQAIAAFLQVWQAERNRKKAEQAYFTTKAAAATDKGLIDRAAALQTRLQSKPHLAKLITNRLGRCEDLFEEALRNGKEDQLDGAAAEYNVCKCKILNAIREAQAGELDGDLEELWNKLDCPVRLNLRRN